MLVAKVTLLALNTLLRESSSGYLTLPDFVAAKFACVSTPVLLKVGQSSVTHVLASEMGDRIEFVSMPFLAMPHRSCVYCFCRRNTMF